MDIKPEVGCSKNVLICRCCLSTEKRMLQVDKFRYYFMDLADIIVSDSDGLPQHICTECVALLVKAVRFKQKIIKSHELLYDYHSRCVPFAVDGQDPELMNHSCPLLSETCTLVFDTLSSKGTGFHDTLQHEVQNRQPLLDCIAVEAPNAVAFDIDVKEESYNADYHDDDMFDFEERLPDPENLLEIKEEKQESKTKDNKKKVKPQSPTKPKDTSKKTKKRAKIEIDETKIKIITLDPYEQLRQQEEEIKTKLSFPFYCKLCFKGFIYEDKLKNHMQKHSPSRGPFKCEVCSMHLPSAYSLSVHTLIHTRRFECRQCGRRMIDKDSIINHYRSEHEGVMTIFTCHFCGKIFNNSKTLRGHVRNVHTGARAACDTCGKSFVTADALAEHRLIHAGLKSHECALCQRRFRTRPQLRVHQARHRDDRNFYCVECDVRFKTSSALKQHLKRSLRHSDAQTFVHECGVCGKRLASERALAHHRAVQHEGARPHACPSCPAALASRSSLRKHIRAQHHGHKRARDHVCDTCGRLFTAKSTLVNHMRTHTGEKPFTCAECGRTFAQRTAMYTHVKLVHLKWRSAKGKPKEPTEFQELKCKEEVTVPYEWSRQNAASCTVTAGP